MTLKHTQDYKWAFKQSATPFITAVDLDTLVATHTGEEVVSHDWSGVNTETFKLNDVTINMITNCDTTAAIAAAMTTAITVAGLFDFTVVADTGKVKISSPYSFELAEGNGALTTIKLTEGIYTGSAFDCENGVTNLPFWKMNKERFYGAAGRVFNPVKSKDHIDCSFPMFLMTDTFLSAAITDQENAGSVPTQFQIIWTDGIKIYSGEDCYIAEYKLTLSPEDYPLQEVKFQYKNVKELATATNFPFRSDMPPQDLSEFSIKIDTVAMSDVISAVFTATPGIEGSKLATTFSEGIQAVIKKDATLEIVCKDSALSAVYDTNQSSIATGYVLEVICGLGTLESTVMYVEDCTRAAVPGEPGIYEYTVTFMNSKGDAITWS